MMLVVIFFAFFIAVFCEEYNDKADSAYRTKTSSSKYPFPAYTLTNTDEFIKFKVTTSGDSEIVFDVVRGEDPLKLLLTDHKSLILSSIIFSHDDDIGTHCALRFTWPNTIPGKIIIRSDVFTPPSKPKLQDHARRHAAFIKPMTVINLNEMITRRDRQTTYIKLKSKWIRNLLAKGTPRFSPVSMSNYVRVYLSPPSIVDADILQKLIELKQVLKDDSSEEATVRCC